MLKLVPFNGVWINNDKIDIHAIYRRPRYVLDAYGESHREYDKDGVPTWDLTGALPIKQHNVWIAKGFEYVTLSDKNSLYTAGRFGTIPNNEQGDWRQYDQHQTGGPWNYRKYAEGQTTTTTALAEQIQKDVETFGSAAVEAIRKQMDPSFELPNHLRGVAPGGKVKKGGQPAEKVA